MKLLAIKKNWITPVPIAVVLLLFVMFLLQDLIHSWLRNYSFYLSEAALFNGFWLLFLPGIVFSRCWLDRLRLGDKERLPRAIWLITITATAHFFLFVLWVHFGSRLFFNHVYGLEWTFRYTLAEHLFSTIVGYGLIILTGMIKGGDLLTKSTNTPKPLTVFAQRLAVKTNLQTIYLEIDEITCLRAESPYVAIHAQGRKYLEDTSLKALVSELPPDRFVRIHRSCIVNLSWVRSSVSRGNGDYDIVLRDGSVHRLSRNYAKGYKHSIAQHQLNR